MKIHGTAKGGALSTKDFGVAFGAPVIISPVAFDAQATNNSATTEQSLTISGFTVADNGNRVLIVAVMTYNLSPVVSGITWNSGGEAFTQAATSVVGGDGRSDLWYLVNPTATTANIVVSWATNAGKKVIGVYSFYNAAQVDPIGATADATGIGTVIDVDVTPTVEGSIIVDSIAHLAGAGATLTDTLTAGWAIAVNNDNRYGGSQYSLTPTISSANAMDWSITESGAWSWCGIELKQAT